MEIPRLLSAKPRSPVIVPIGYNIPMPRRFQFSLRGLFVVVLVVAAFFGGVEWHRRAVQAVVFWERKSGDEGVGEYLRIDTLVLPDGTRWFRPVFGGTTGRSLTFFEDGAEINVKAPAQPSGQ